MGKQQSWMARAMSGLSRGLCGVVIGLIRLYQGLVSPLLGPCCRFYPSCSVYAVEAVQQHGLLKGLWLSLLRVCKCHPFHPGGVDVVPPPRVQQAGKVI